MLTAQLPVVPPRSRTTDVLDAPGAVTPDGEACAIGTLLLRVADGNVAGFDELYRCTSHRVYGLVRKVLIDAEMSAETMQDVYLALWLGAAGRFDPSQGSGMSWIMTIAHRRAVDRVRSEQAHRIRDLRWGIKNQDVDYDEVVDPVIQRIETDMVRAGLDELSPVQREAIDLAYFAGMTYVEVAGHLGIPVPTAKTRIRDGIKRLRTSLQASAWTDTPG